MGNQSITAHLRHLPQVLLATFAVVGLPILAVSLLHASGSVTSVIALIAAGTALSLVASYAGAALWAARGRGGDTVFGDLMLWGWLRRWRTEWQLASAVRLLGMGSASGGRRPPQLSLSRRERLLRQLAAALEARDPYTHGHSRRVARHAAAIARRMGLPREEVARVRTAAAVHDVGKVETPDSVLKKTGGLTDAEFAKIQRHSAAGARMVAGLGDEELVEIVRHHHERIDGKGYPDGVAGDRIPIGARIVAVADTFDAITSARPYRSAKSHREALDLLGAEAGTQLDPDAVRAFRGYYSGIRSVALWAFAVNGPRQLLALLPDQIRLGNVGLATKVTATAAATVATGSVAVQSLPPPPQQSQDRGAAAVRGKPAVPPGAGAVARWRPAASGQSFSSTRARSSTVGAGDPAALPVSTAGYPGEGPAFARDGASQPGGDGSGNSDSSRGGSETRKSAGGDSGTAGDAQTRGGGADAKKSGPSPGKGGGPPAERGGGPPIDVGGGPIGKDPPVDVGGGPPIDVGGPPVGIGGPPVGKGGGPPVGKGGGPPKPALGCCR